MVIGKLVLIEWKDSQYVPGWHRDDPPIVSLRCRSVGWLIYDGQDSKTIAAHVTDEDDPQRSGEMTIPTGSIIMVTDL